MPTYSTFVLSTWYVSFHTMQYTMTRVGARVTAPHVIAIAGPGDGPALRFLA